MLTLAAAQGLGDDKKASVKKLAMTCKCPPGPLSPSKPIVVSTPRHDLPNLDQWRQELNGKSFLYLPIWESKSKATLLIVTNSTVSRKWRDDELSTIGSFSNRASATLENAHLHQQLEWAAALEERQRIAANIHDGLAQTLSLLGLKVDQVSESIGKRINGGLMDELNGVREAVQQASVEARRAIANLHQAPGPRQSLQELLSEMVTCVINNDQLSTQIRMETPEPLYLTMEENSRLLPIIREMLVNVLHHSQAAQITLSLRYDGRQGQISIEDDGCGFDPQRPRVDEAGHFGLTIMRARAVQLNGRIEIDSEVGRGTRICLIWPVQSRRAQSVEKAGRDRKNHDRSAISQFQTVEANFGSQNRLRRGHHEETSGVVGR